MSAWSFKDNYKNAGYSVQARSGESPARYGEIIGPDLNQLAVASSSSPWRVSSAQNPARHEYSLITRRGEFMQKCPVLQKSWFFNTTPTTLLLVSASTYINII
jgi:hypothetical protein